MTPATGDRVVFHLLRSHVCGGIIQHCECNYPIGMNGPKGYRGATVVRPATVVGVSADGSLELDVDLTAEDVEIYGFTRLQTRVMRSLPASGTWTPPPLIVAPPSG